MRQRDDIHVMVVITRLHDAPHDVLEHVVLAAEDLIDRERADGEDQFRLEDGDLRREVRLAALDFFRVGAPIAAAVRLAGKAARDGCKVHALSDGLFIGAGRVGEPPKERLSRGPREGAAERALARAWSLAVELDRRGDGGAVDVRPLHLGALGAGRELLVEQAKARHTLAASRDGGL